MLLGFLISNLVPEKLCITKSLKETYSPKGYASIAFTRNAATAALACAEILSHPKLDKTLINSLLLEGLVKHLESHCVIINERSSLEIAEKIFPKLIKSLHDFYEYSKSNDPEFKDIIKTVNSECDIEFLHLVTDIFAKEYVKQEYSQFVS